MTDASGDGTSARHDGDGVPQDWEELEPQREWTPADRWRLAAWVLVFLDILALLLFAPLGDGGLVRAAEVSGADAGDARLLYWVALIGCTAVGCAVGAAAAATKRRWAIVPPALGALGSWAGFFIAMAMAS